MQPLELIDEDTPIEEYPGFLGWVWDHELVTVDPKLEFLKNFSWNEYFEFLQTVPPRTLYLELSTGAADVSISEDSHLAAILDQIPSISVTIDIPENQGPGGGVGHVFFIHENTDYVSAVNDIKILIDALQFDYQSFASG